jgi:acetyl esterase/lipase
MRFEHPFDLRDRPFAQANRAARAATKGHLLGVHSRASFAQRKRVIPAADGVAVSVARVGGVPGCWCRPAHALPGAKILFLHGGGFILGSAESFATFAGQIAARARADVFVADYRLAPEHPFPAGLDDAIAAYEGLVREGPGRIAVVGDSAGGGLALSLVAALTQGPRRSSRPPSAAAVMSPWTDLTLSGKSCITRAEADPVFTRDVLQDIANNYLNGADPANPAASPLFGSLAGLPPIRIDVGEDELILDDSIRYEVKATDAGVAVSLNIWKGMPHVFQTGIGRVLAADASMEGIGAFLRERLSGPG